MSKAKLTIMGLVVVLALPMLAFGQKTSKIPTISTLSPNTKTAGAGSFALTVTGSNFTSGSTVRWKGVGLTTVYVSSTQLQAPVAGTQITTAGTASVTVYTSGRAGGTSNTLSFTIAAPAQTTTITTTPPPPSPSPLSITTSSVPAATANTAYNTNLAGSGGTPTYVWSLPSGNTLPPGLILATTGTLTGTPTAGGTYSFTVQARDSASSAQTAQKVFSMSVASPTPPPPPPDGSTGPLWSTGFETGDPAFEAINSAPDTVVTSSPPAGRSGNALQIHYTICGAIDGTCGGKSQDKNRWVSKIINPGLSTFYMRGYAYFKSPEPTATQGTLMQRKLMWVGDSTSAGNNVAGNYQIVINSWNGSGGVVSPTLSIAALVQMTGGSTCGPAGWQIYNLASGINWDTWNAVEFMVQLNTPGSADGVLTVWLNGVQTYTNSALNFRGSCTTPVSFFGVGDQTNRYNYDAVDEYRYWDDIAVGTSYIP